MRTDASHDLALGLQALEGRVTELVSVVRGMAVNGVLRVELIKIPDTGRATIDTAVPFAAVAVDNHTAATLIVAAAPEERDAPAAGVGVIQVGAQRGKVSALTGNILTIYGTAGGTVDVQLFTSPQPASFS
jgi:hypothetical protein